MTKRKNLTSADHAAMKLDRLFFEACPDRAELHRAPYPGEFAGVTPAGTYCSNVVVVQESPGFQYRVPSFERLPAELLDPAAPPPPRWSVRICYPPKKKAR
jgi:hypothetical protein